VKLAVETTDATFAPGGWVRGAVRVVEGGGARELTVSLRYRERSEAYSHVAVEVPGTVLHTGDLATGERYEFAIALPNDALPPQQLRNGELWWEVAARCNKPGPDAHATARIASPAGPGMYEHRPIGA
jgi:hypothetical protein